MSVIVSLALACASSATGQVEPPPPAQSPPPPPDTTPPQPGAVPPPGSAEAGYSDDDPSALTAFRDVLDPNGTWVDDPAYGLVWVPNPDVVGPDFEPYVSSGQWAYDDSWTWVSDYSWGWVPFHYGRWVHTGGEGWAWVPGRRYAGAWVDWRVGNGYVGWAPAPPEWAWRGGRAGRLGSQVAPAFVFSPQANVFAPQLSRHVVRGPTWMSRTTPYAQVAPQARRGGRAYGPPPTALGIPANRVVHPPERNEGLKRAVQYSKPATAPHVNAAPPRPQRAAQTQPPANNPVVRRPAPQPAPNRTPAEPRRGVTAPQPTSHPTPAPAPAPHPTTAPAPHPTTPVPTPHPSTAPAPQHPHPAPATQHPAPAPRAHPK